MEEKMTRLMLLLRAVDWKWCNIGRNSAEGDQQFCIDLGGIFGDFGDSGDYVKSDTFEGAVDAAIARLTVHIGERARALQDALAGIAPPPQRGC